MKNESNKKGKTTDVFLTMRTAVYLRVSQDDGDRKESDSITNQRKLILDYISHNEEFRFISEYVDDGYSGSNFDRPGWKRLYEELESGRINCIIVKDLSRLGRNYIEVGRYLQTIFPALGVRLIAINDNFDTADEWQGGDSLTVPMKNLINDYYCREVSRKVTTQLSAMRRRGECVTSFVPYGYQKNPKDRSKLIVDSRTAPTVRQIFDWKLEGYGNRTIAEKLNDSGVLSPYEYRVSNGEKIGQGFKKYDKALWAAGSIYSILHNECYTGTLVQGKWRKLSYRSDEMVLLPEDEWTRVPGTHEAIVEQNLFRRVQEIMQREIKTTGGECAAILSGFLFCGVCSRQMTLKSTYHKDKKYRYYVCKDCEKSGRHSNRISEKKAVSAILKAIRDMAEIAVDMERQVEKSDFRIESSGDVRRIDKRLASLQEELDRAERLKSGLYRDYDSGILTREEYMDYSLAYSDKIEYSKKALRALEDERERLISCCENAEWVRSFKKHRNISELSRPILSELLDKVLVYEGGRMEIRFRDEAAIQAMLEAYGYEDPRKETREDEKRNISAELRA